MVRCHLSTYLYMQGSKSGEISAVSIFTECGYTSWEATLLFSLLPILVGVVL